MDCIALFLRPPTDSPSMLLLYVCVGMSDVHSNTKKKKIPERVQAKKTCLKRDKKLQTGRRDTQFVTLHPPIFEGLPGLMTQRPPFRAV